MRAARRDDLVENKRGEMEGAEGSVIASKQAEPATAGGRGAKSSLEETEDLGRRRRKKRR